MKALLAAVLVACSAAAFAQAKDGVPVPGPTLDAGKAGKAGSYRTVNWDELVPKDWDPMAEFKGLDFSILQDGDPRAAKMLQKMREVWDNAPANPALVGQAIRIPGFVVPLEETKDGLKEFLLVPYFGACIHSPPPPANQIIHVLPRSVAKGVRSMDPVWISGTLAQVKTDSYMGAAGYRVEAVVVEPYKQEPKR